MKNQHKVKIRKNNYSNKESCPRLRDKKIHQYCSTNTVFEVFHEELGIYIHLDKLSSAHSHLKISHLNDLDLNKLLQSIWIFLVN